MFNLSPIYSARKSSNHKLFKNHKISPVHKFTSKQNIHKHQTQNFQRIHPSGITPVKKAQKARTRCIMDHSIDLSIPDFLKSIKKEWTEAVKNIYIYINAYQQIPVPYSSMLHIPPNNWFLLAAKQERYKKSISKRKMLKKFPEKSSGEWACRQKKKDRTEKLTGLGRRTREEIVKWNQLKALRFQTGRRHQTSSASLRGF